MSCHYSSIINTSFGWFLLLLVSIQVGLICHRKNKSELNIHLHQFIQWVSPIQTKQYSFSIHTDIWIIITRNSESSSLYTLKNDHVYNFALVLHKNIHWSENNSASVTIFTYICGDNNNPRRKCIHLIFIVCIYSIILLYFFAFNHRNGAHKHNW